MANSWCRLYAEILEDHKVQMLSDGAHRLWVTCLALATRNDGWLPLDDDALAWSMRRKRAQVEKYKAELFKSGLLEMDGEHLTLHGWKRRQFVSDTSTDRAKRYRDKTRSNGLTVGAYEKSRKEIFERDGGLCIYCLSVATCIDHVVPINQQGDDHVLNLAAACRKCNSGKSGRTPTQAGYEIKGDAYSLLYQRNIERLHIFKERRHGDRSQSVTVTGDVNGVIGDAHLSESVSVSDSVSEESKKDHANFSPCGRHISEWADVLYGRHPKKKSRPMVEDFFSRLLVDWKARAKRADVATRDELFTLIEKAHERACRSTDWTKECGRYAPKLGEWLEDEGYTAFSGGQDSQHDPAFAPVPKFLGHKLTSD